MTEQRTPRSVLGPVPPKVPGTDQQPRKREAGGSDPCTEPRFGPTACAHLDRALGDKDSTPSVVHSLPRNAGRATGPASLRVPGGWHEVPTTWLAHDGYLTQPFLRFKVAMGIFFFHHLGSKTWGEESSQSRKVKSWQKRTGKASLSSQDCSRIPCAGFHRGTSLASPTLTGP